MSRAESHVYGRVSRVDVKNDMKPAKASIIRVDPESDVNQFDGTSYEFTLDDLPPLPAPDYKSKRLQACGGCITVLAITATLVGFTWIPLQSRYFPVKMWWICSTLIYAEAIVAMVCLLGLMFGDPGVIKRSPENCFPLPQKVAEGLRTRRTAAHVGKNVEGDDATFCVRCCVWRPKKGETGEGHHCSTCGRCVRDFDHHCVVFGRCIAGSGFGGNMGYFKILISMAVASFFTCGMTHVSHVGANHRVPRSQSSRLRGGGRLLEMPYAHNPSKSWSTGSLPTFVEQSLLHMQALS